MQGVTIGGLKDNMEKIYHSKNGFKCAYCGQKCKGAYKIVDDEKSCEQCNRAYDYKPSKEKTEIKCPVCKGEGILRP
jgi:hypothetical protein